jgi:hypothetical protein
MGTGPPAQPALDMAGLAIDHQKRLLHLDMISK